MAERFFEGLPQEEGLRDFLESERLDSSKPLIVVFAEKLMNDASARMREEDMRMDVLKMELAAPDGDSSAELIRRAPEDHAVVYFGSVVSSMWDFLSKGRIDYRKHVQRINEAFLGTRLKPINLEQLTGSSSMRFLSLPESEREKFWHLFETDRTLSRFFENTRFLPKPLTVVPGQPDAFELLGNIGFLAQWRQKALYLVDEDLEDLNVKDALDEVEQILKEARRTC